MRSKDRIWWILAEARNNRQAAKDLLTEVGWTARRAVANLNAAARDLRRQTR